MNTKRQAVTPILSTVILISIGLVIVAGVSTHYLGISYDALNCEIQSAEIFKISDSVFWGAIKVYNNGEYTIAQYSIIIHDDAQEIIVKNRADEDENIPPKKSTTKDFEITQTISSENILVEFSIFDADSVSQCTQVVKI